MYYPRTVDPELIEYIKTYPPTDSNPHCGRWHEISPFIVYWKCPVCEIDVKVRCFSAVLEVADLFDAVFLWIEQTPGADELVVMRRRQIAAQLREERAEGRIAKTRIAEHGKLRLADEYVDVPPSLLSAIKGFPPFRDVEHCGVTFEVSPFEPECACPKCGVRLVLRASSSVQIEDVFDAVFYWMEIADHADELVEDRRRWFREDLID
jgi:hypothetical protein